MRCNLTYTCQNSLDCEGSFNHLQHTTAGKVCSIHTTSGHHTLCGGYGVLSSFRFNPFANSSSNWLYLDYSVNTVSSACLTNGRHSSNSSSKTRGLQNHSQHLAHKRKQESKRHLPPANKKSFQHYPIGPLTNGSYLGLADAFYSWTVQGHTSSVSKTGVNLPICLIDHFLWPLSSDCHSPIDNIAISKINKYFFGVALWPPVLVSKIGQ